MTRVAYVTGGMGGIGTAICRKFHDMGFKVIAGCGPTRDFNKWIAEQKADGYTFHVSVGNVADWQSTKDAFDKVKAEHGNPDILVNTPSRVMPARKSPCRRFSALVRSATKSSRLSESRRSTSEKAS